MRKVAASYVLLLQCPDRRGIVAAVSTNLVENLCTITESGMFNDTEHSQFFLRIVFQYEGKGKFDLEAFSRQFHPIAESCQVVWSVHDLTTRPKVLIAVSKFGHCLYDLLHRWRAGLLPIDIVGVVSNHDDMRSFVEWSGIPYHHLPVEKHDKSLQQEKLLALINELGADLIVLARYMQILSPAVCDALNGRCINIHHSFLPSFKGAKPYHQAHVRGVKIIGATAHYVTTDLDEGPIIEQGIERVSHSHSAEDLVTIGRDIECAVLARAVAWHVQHRVVLNGQRTVVFR